MSAALIFVNRATFTYIYQVLLHLQTDVFLLSNIKLFDKSHVACECPLLAARRLLCVCCTVTSAWARTGQTDAVLTDRHPHKAWASCHRVLVTSFTTKTQQRVYPASFKSLPCKSVM